MFSIVYLTNKTCSHVVHFHKVQCCNGHQASDSWPWHKLPTLLKADLVTQLHISTMGSVIHVGTVVVFCVFDSLLVQFKLSELIFIDIA